VAERDGFEPAVPLVQHETANFCDFAFSAREAEGVSEAGGAGEGLAAGRVTSDMCVFPEKERAGMKARSLRSACARSGGGVLLAEPFWTRVASSFDSASAASTIHYD